MNTLHSSTVLPVSNFNTTFSGNHEYSTLSIIQVTVCCIIFVISVFGNSVVTTVVCRKRRMQTATNWLIVNLALSDLAVTLICIPLEIPLFLNGQKWPYGGFFCRMLYPLQTMTVYLSVFTLVALSLSRYWAIVYPMRRQPSVKHAKICIGVIWLLGFAAVIPYILLCSLPRIHHLAMNPGVFRKQRTIQYSFLFHSISCHFLSSLSPILLLQLN